MGSLAAKYGELVDYHGRLILWCAPPEDQPAFFMPSAIDIEDPDQLILYLQQNGYIAPGEKPRVKVLQLENYRQRPHRRDRGQLAG